LTKRLSILKNSSDSLVNDINDKQKQFTTDGEMVEPALSENITGIHDDVADISEEIERYKEIPRYKLYFEMKDIMYQNTIEWADIYLTYLLIEEYRQPENFEKLVKEIRADGKQILIDLLFKAIQGTNEEELKQYIKDYIQNKLEQKKSELLEKP
jgi:predicted ATP-dependent Lon-type protease